MELLTEQQKLILKKRAKGVTNAEIARELNVSPSHISQTFKDIREKITTVDSTLALLKETGYMDDTITLPITEQTLEKLKSLPIPKIKKTKIQHKQRLRTRQNIQNDIIHQIMLSTFVRIPSTSVSYSHTTSHYRHAEIPMSEMLITNSVS